MITANTEWPVLCAQLCAHQDAFAEWASRARTDGAVAYLDKPEGWTSFDCVARLRSTLKQRRVGHAGTLDPLATGVLVICLGKATKAVLQYQETTKTYTVVGKLGATTPTDDRGSAEEVNPQATIRMQEISAPEIADALQEFVGEQVQIPPTYSAIKHSGKPQYTLARNGREFVVRPRIISIYSITDVTVSLPFVSLTMECSSGTYVRSVIRDLGAKLGVGGYVWQLRRTRVGEVYERQTITMQTYNTLVTTSEVYS